MSASEHAALLAAERVGQPFLAHRDAHGDLRIIPLDDTDSLRVGRSADNDVVLAADAEVSRTHTELRAIGAGWMLHDEGMSRNGTYVNGERVTRSRRLQDRDVVRIGHSILLFRQPTPAGDVSTAISTAAREVRLTEAERRILVALCRPLLAAAPAPAPATNQEIAEELVISLSSVKTHVRSLFTKIDVDDLPPNRKRDELARRALEMGLVSTRDL